MHCARARPATASLSTVDTHPQILAVLRTRAEPLGVEVVVADLSGGLPDGEFAGVLISYPGSSGRIPDLATLIAAAHERKALALVTTDLLALTLLTPPGELGADVVVGSAQRFGVPLGFGGPHAGFMSVRAGLERGLPGRLVGVSLDADGAPAYRLALQTREQHIRREKATSNICTAQVLLAVISSMYAAYHGPSGLTEIARRSHEHARVLAAGILQAGGDLATTDFFDTVRWAVPGGAEALVAAALAEGVNVRLIDADTVSASTDELTTPAHVEAVWRAYATVNAVASELKYDEVTPDVDLGIPERVVRTSPFLTHPVFSAHHSETSMLRYIRKLGDRDIALDRAMIPLGSCTMKLNATTEMEPITWPEFANIHPFAPLDQADGYLDLIRTLEAWLVEVTGYDAVSLQPNAGSQGEFAGLLAIRAFHRANGHGERDICLIPSSAHGTNAASAVMAGMRVVVVACDEQGNVDLDDPGGQGHRARGRPRRADGHLPLDAWCLRDRNRRDLRARPRCRRAGLRRRREPQRARGPGEAGALRSRRLPPEPAQDVLASPTVAADRELAPLPCDHTWHRSCRPTRSIPRPDHSAAATSTGESARSAEHRGAVRASCPSRGPTSA